MAQPVAAPGTIAARHVAVIFVHGINANSESFSQPMQHALLKRLPEELSPFVHFRSIFWANEVRNHQREYLGSARRTGGIKHNRLRRYVVEGLGDAAAYQKTRNPENSIYYRVQAQIATTVKYLWSDLGKKSCQDDKSCEDPKSCQDPKCLPLIPLIFIGHSLGCHVISSYLWDMNKLKQRAADDVAKEPIQVKNLWKDLDGADPFRRLETCAGFVTLGSNMPVFAFTFGPHAFHSVTSRPEDQNGRLLAAAFPGPALPKTLQEKARWLNFYSTWDILGFPLKSLNEEYRKAEIIHDIRVRSELPWFIPYVWCIFAHKRYWTNRVVLRETVKLIRDMIETPA